MLWLDILKFKDCYTINFSKNFRLNFMRWVLLETFQDLFLKVLKTNRLIHPQFKITQNKELPTWNLLIRNESCFFQKHNKDFLSLIIWHNEKENDNSEGYNVPFIPDENIFLADTWKLLKSHR